MTARATFFTKNLTAIFWGVFPAFFLNIEFTYDTNSLFFLLFFENPLTLNMEEILDRKPLDGKCTNNEDCKTKCHPPDGPMDDYCIVYNFLGTDILLNVISS